MTTSRREFLQQAVQGLALVVAVPALGCRTRPSGPPLTGGEWLEIAADGTVTLVLDKAEMGQGVSTALPMIMAEELGADWARVRVVPARPGPRFPEMGTAGSGSVVDAWYGHRVAAARAREMLIAAAAVRWTVPPGECFTENGFVRYRDRRLAFAALVDAARQLPVPEAPRFKDPERYTLLGTRVPDPAAPAIVTGTIRYGFDHTVPGMLYAVIARSPTAGGRCVDFDGEGARAVAGVREVIEVPAGVAVVATSTWAALEGRKALSVRWADGPNARFDNAEGWRRLEGALARGGKIARRAGNAERALRRADRRFDAEFRWTWQAHAAIEPLSAVADVRDGRCEIWAGMQSPNGAQVRVAQALEIPAENVVVNVLRLGGGFGRRIANDFIVEAAQVSRAAGAPVKVLWSREDDYRHDMYNPAQLNRLSAGVDAAGRIVAWRHRVADFHLSMFGPFNPATDPAAEGDPWGGFDSPYDVADLEVELALSEAPVRTGAWRSVTYPAAVLARESFLDEIAHATGQDPVGIRLALIPSPGAVRRGDQDVPNGDRLRRVLQLAAERAGWGEPLPAAEPGRRVGRGIACNPYHRGTMVAQVAEVSVGAAGDIRVHRIVSVVDCGQVINRTGVEQQFEGGIGWALTALLGPGVRFNAGRTVGGGFGDYPILTIDRMPRVETHVVASTVRPFGLGEPPVPAVAPAVLNAVFQATGVRLRTLPLDPTRLRV
ncbi:MAG: molybdopterin cofactor-binding domain-containing protein [Gemmatimonadales bacterium]